MPDLLTPMLTHPAVSRYVVSAADFLTHEFNAECSAIVCGDSLEVLPHLPDDSVDLIHTSPPYNIEKPYASGVTDKAPLSEYLEFLGSAIEEMKRVVRPGGSIFWQTGYTQDKHAGQGIVPIDHLSHDLFQGGSHPLHLWDRIIWRYWGGHAFTKKFTNKHETIMWYVKPGAEPHFFVDEVRERAKSYDKRNNFWGRNPGNVWEVDRVAFGSAGQTSHIAVFPEELSERIVRACSLPGEMILDPFSGSGTVAKVARGLGRRWLGIEISPEYAIESALRIGHQQSAEHDALGSELILRLAFADGAGSRTLEATSQLLRGWLTEVGLETRQAEFERDLSTVFAERNGRTPVKAEIWGKYDDLLKAEGRVQIPMIASADAMLCKRYKLRHRLNGVSRFRSLLRVIGDLEAAVAATSPEAYVQRIALQEPSTYVATRDSVSLNVDGLLTIGEGGVPGTDAFSDDQPSVEEQGRML